MRQSGRTADCSKLGLKISSWLVGLSRRFSGIYRSSILCRRLRLQGHAIEIKLDIGADVYMLSSPVLRSCDLGMDTVSQAIRCLCLGHSG